PQTWQPDSRSRIKPGSFNVLMTNPPFGTRIKIESPRTLEQFDLAHELLDGVPINGVSHQDPAILFIERARQLLQAQNGDKRAGRLAIVLPRQILSGHDTAMLEIRNWILRHFRPIAVVDMPPETFQPYTGTITSVLFA